MTEPLPSDVRPSPPCPRDCFAALIGRAEGAIDLAEAALWISAEEDPSADVPAALARLEELADEARQRLAATPEGPGAELMRLERLREFLFVDQGFAGDRDEYHDPANSLLDRVLERRRGNPISLAVVLMDVGRRVGVPLLGVGFPGHFLVRHARHPHVLLDPFAGVLLTPADCREILARVCGGHIPFHPRLLAPVSPRAILLRMLNNLRAIYQTRGDAERTLAVLDRILLLAPDDAVHLRERGLLRLARGVIEAGLADLALYLRSEPEAPDRAAIEGLVGDVNAPPAWVH